MVIRAHADRSLTRAALAVSFALVASFSAPAHAFCRMTAPPSPSGSCELHRVVSWPVTCVGISLNTRELSAPLDAGQSLDALMRRHLAPAALAWSEVSCGSSLALVVAPDVDLPLDLALDGRNVVSVNRRWTPDAYHRPGTIAFTVVTTDIPTATRLEADVELDARSMENPLGRAFDDGAPSWGVADMASVLLHELGHVVGLDHSFAPGAVMQSSMEVERQRRVLTRDDLDGACALHPVSPARPRPARDCAPEIPVAPPIRPSASGGCCASHRRRDAPSSGISVAVGALVATRRRRPRPRRRPPSP